MSLQLLQRIEQAEAKAEELRQDAQRNARDMLKSVEEACITHEREATLKHRALSRRMLEDAQVKMASHLAQASKEQAALRVQEMASAKLKLKDAVQFIFERVVNHGDR